MRVGIGYDVHRLVEGRPLVLGGVRVPFRFGLEGHSDADVLVHAIMDALLGAMGEKDIGYHFPASDERFRNFPSLTLLTEIKKLMEKKGYRLVNIDSIIIAEQPKLTPYIPAMIENLARVLNIAGELINVKATTTEKLDSFGRGEGMAAEAVVLLRKINS